MGHWGYNFFEVELLVGGHLVKDANKGTKNRLCIQVILQGRDRRIFVHEGTRKN